MATSTEQTFLALSQEIESALADTGLAGAPIIPVSTVSGEGVEQLRTANKVWSRHASHRR